jgi:S-adenosylmethionine/arginine decarboxylase-like enzyme
MMRPGAPQRYAFHLDAYAKPTLLSNVVYLEQTMRTIIKDIGMRLISLNTAHVKEELPLPPVGIDQASSCRQRFAPDGGYSIQALITTSHVAIHTWPEVAFFMFDVVSCKPFEQQRLRMLLDEYLGVSEVVNEYAWPVDSAAAVGAVG